MSFFLPVRKIGTIIFMARKKTPICVCTQTKVYFIVILA